MKKQLQKIANTLVLYSYHVQNDGLLNGKMGIILFLYRYAEYSGYKHYREFADNLLDYVLESVAHITTGFEDGLSGIGWTVNYLMKEGLVDGNSNDVLQDVDKKVFSSYKYNPHSSILGQVVYLIGRLEENQSSANLDKYIIRYLNFCETRIKEYKGGTSLYHINSILFFLCNIEDNLSDKEVIISLQKDILENLQSVFKDKLFDEADLYIFRRMLDETDAKQKLEGWNSVLSPYMPARSDDFDIETMIRISWQEMLYFGNSKLKEITIENISLFIESKQESLVLNDFLFAQGLSGLGNMVLFTNTKV